MKNFEITKTLEPHSVEIVQLSEDSSGEFRTGENWTFEILKKEVIQESEVVKDLWNLWKNLPPAEICKRCHLPKFGITFLDETQELILNASICWECDNIYIKTPEGFAKYYFKASESSSKKLLKNIKKLLENQKVNLIQKLLRRF